MEKNNQKSISILWVYAGNLSTALNKATWISTTKALRRFGCDVSLLSNEENGKKSIEGVEVECFSSSNVYFLGKLIYHLKVIKVIFHNRKKLDVVLFHPESGIFLLPLIFLRKIFHRTRPLFVVDIRTVHMASKEEMNWRMEIRKIYFHFIQWVFNHYIDGQTAITQRLADYLHIPHQKCWGIWESGVDLELFEPCIQQRDWSHIEQSVHLVYIGTLNDGRNVGVFCQAVIKRALAGENFFLTVIGSGYESQSIAQLANEYPTILHYHQPVPHKDIPLWLSKAHLGILPFPNEVKFQVSSPIKLFEYLASGLGIIATKIVPHLDYLGDSEFVFWAENSTIEHFETALQQVWKNRTYLPELSKKAAIKAQSWSWEEATYKLYQSLLKGLSQ